MPPDAIVLRPARREDAAAIALLTDLASDGLAPHFWARIAEPGQTALAVGTERAARDEGSFSWRGAVIAEVDGSVAGGMICYPVGLEAVPLDDLPGVARPLQALENQALGCLYVNVLASFADFRRLGVARRLLAHAAERAGPAGTSLIVADSNEPALALYRRAGFVERAREPMVKEDWPGSGTQWVLMVKPK